MRYPCTLTKLESLYTHKSGTPVHSQNVDLSSRGESRRVPGGGASGIQRVDYRGTSLERKRTLLGTPLLSVRYLCSVGNPHGSHRGKYFWKIRCRGSPIRFATKFVTHLLWDVNGSCTCVVIFVEKSHFPEILAAMCSGRLKGQRCESLPLVAG